MLDRTLTKLLRQRLGQFPAVTLVGPRQCGKTTLARTLARQYFNLEAPEERFSSAPDRVQEAQSSSACSQEREDGFQVQGEEAAPQARHPIAR